MINEPTHFRAPSSDRNHNKIVAEKIIDIAKEHDVPLYSVKKVTEVRRQRTEGGGKLKRSEQRLHDAGC